MQWRQSYSPALLTDLYEITMAYGYWKLGMASSEGVFNLYFRKNPFAGGYALACGLGTVIEMLQAFRFEASDVEYLGTLKGNDGAALFEKEFLDYLAALRIDCDIDAIPEGTVVFPNEPLVRVRGSLLTAQILETSLLNIVNFETLIATKAARICEAAKGEPVLEFGLRRAQGVDGGLTASRASYIGGCAATSNLLAGKVFGIPVSGTHAHSWVMSFDDELEAFRSYAEVMPNNCVFLVDTYDTLEGVRHAVQIGRELRRKGGSLVGVRLDSGDLAYLSSEARKILDDGGFPDAAIYASNELDEQLITSLKLQGAKITRWGVGTRLVTGYGQSALGGVYKLTAIRKEGEPWEYKLKLSEQTAKISTPGILQVRRFRDGNLFAGDMIFDEETGTPADEATIVDPVDPMKRKTFGRSLTSETLLVSVLRRGELVYESPSLEAIRDRARGQLESFHPSIRRFENPHTYPVGLEQQLYNLKAQMILDARGQRKAT